MSHPEQVGFFRAVRDANTPVIAGSRILEIGSYDVNGTIRDLFEGAATYVGVDLEEGPGVDRVCYGHEVDDPDASFDTVISGECFEHDPHWRDTFTTMVRLTRPGGVVAFTCASRGRVEHGTARSDVTQSPGTRAMGLDHYRNLVASDFADLPLQEWFSEHRFWYHSSHSDLFFAGVRTGDATTRGSLPDPAAVEALEGLMSLPQRAIRTLPRALGRTRITEERFQDLMVPYWTRVVRLHDLATRRLKR